MLNCDVVGSLRRNSSGDLASLSGNTSPLRTPDWISTTRVRVWSRITCNFARVLCLQSLVSERHARMLSPSPGAQRRKHSSRHRQSSGQSLHQLCFCKMLARSTVEQIRLRWKRKQRVRSLRTCCLPPPATASAATTTATVLRRQPCRQLSRSLQLVLPRRKPRRYASLPCKKLTGGA